MKKEKRSLYTVLLSTASILVLVAVVALAVKIANQSSQSNHNSFLPPSGNSVQQNTSGTSQPDTGLKTFTVAELKQYDGKNGHPAYVAVSGKVYDVTNSRAWRKGTHQGYAAGQDLTDAINSAPHGTSVLDGLPVVGTLVP